MAIGLLRPRRGRGLVVVPPRGTEIGPSRLGARPWASIWVSRRRSRPAMGRSSRRVSFTDDIERKIAQAQRRGHKRQAKRLHRTAARRRKDALHRFSTKNRRSVSDHRRRRCEQRQTGEDADGQIRARCRLGHAQSATAVQGPAGRQVRSDRQRARHNASMQQLRGPHGTRRPGHAVL